MTKTQRLDITSETSLAMIADMAEAGMTQRAVAESLGIHRHTLAKLFDRHPEVRHAYDSARRKRLVKLGRTLFDMIDDPQTREQTRAKLLIFALKTWCGWHEAPPEQTRDKQPIRATVEIVHQPITPK